MISFSFIIPVYNRPKEVEELFQSFTTLQYDKPYEIVIIEDGSTLSSKPIVSIYEDQLNISYYFKDNTGPGDSRNYGMLRAKGNYFLILDSDVILPSNYLLEVEKGLAQNYTDCFGGPDAAHDSFSDTQKAISHVMTSLITTGGIRGKAAAETSFEPRSFNMGLSKKAFEKTKGFGKIHPGEDPDLSIRLKKLGFKTQLIEAAKVFHKRRIDWPKFFTQVNKFGKVRPILISWHPKTSKLTYWFPTLFCLGFLIAIVFAFFSNYILLLLYGIYMLLVFFESAILNKSIKIGTLSVVALVIQFYGYGLGFLVSTFYIRILGRDPKTKFPKLFFS